MISTKLAVLLIFGIVGGLLFVQGQLSTEAQLDPVPSMHVDIGSSFLASSTGNTFVQDPDSSGSGSGNGFSDQIMSVPPITSSFSKTVNFSGPPTEKFVVTDIIIKNADEMTGADVRINFDPTLIQYLSANLTPFTGAVGFVNLPEESGVHRTASPAFSDAAQNNIDGSAFLAGTYQNNREFDVSRESGPTVDGAVNNLPNRNAGQAPNGGVFLSIRWLLKPASNGQDVCIDLSPGGAWRSGTGGGIITGGSQFVTLTGEDPGGTVEITTLSHPDLFDGVISVNKAAASVSDACPGGHDVEAKNIGGAGGSVAKLFTPGNCDQTTCTLTQVHRLLVANNSTHDEEDDGIRFTYEAVWPQVLIDEGCTLNGSSSSPIPLPSADSPATVNQNATHNAKVTVTYECPASAENEPGVVGAPILFILEAIHRDAGSDAQPDDDPINDILTQSKVLE